MKNNAKFDNWSPVKSHEISKYILRKKIVAPSFAGKNYNSSSSCIKKENPWVLPISFRDKKKIACRKLWGKIARFIDPRREEITKFVNWFRKYIVKFANFSWKYYKNLLLTVDSKQTISKCIFRTGHTNSLCLFLFKCSNISIFLIIIKKLN